MNILAELQKDHSKEITDNIVEYVSGDDERLAELMDIFFHGPWEIVQRAAWAIGQLGEKTDLLIPYLKPMIKNLQRPSLHDAIKRNTIRTWQFMHIPDEHLGEVADICFGYLASNEEAIAIKVFSMVVLEDVVRRVPELKGELQFLIETQLPYGSAGFKNRGQKVLRNIRAL